MRSTGSSCISLLQRNQVLTPEPTTASLYDFDHLYAHECTLLHGCVCLRLVCIHTYTDPCACILLPSYTHVDVQTPSWASVAMANQEPSDDQLADAIRAIKERSPDFGIKRVHAELKQASGWSGTRARGCMPPTRQGIRQ